MHIEHITYHIAKNALCVNDFVKSNEISANEAMIFEKIMGLKYVPRENTTNSFEQIIQVMKKLDNEYDLNKKTIQYIFLAHTADSISPLGFHFLEKIIERLQLNEPQYFGSSLYKCASGFQLIKLLSMLSHTLNEDQLCLLLISDIAFTEILSVIPNSTILGDAATAILLKKSGNFHRLIDVILETQDQFSRGLWAAHDEKLAFEMSYIDNLSNVIKNIVLKNNLLLSKIKCIFPHNVNVISWKRVIQFLALSKEQVYLENIAKTAHCFGSDPFFNLKDGIAQKRILPGDYYLLVTMGMGATFSAMLFQY